MSRKNSYDHLSRVRTVPPGKTHVSTKPGAKKKNKLNPDYSFFGKVHVGLPNMIITATDDMQPTWKGDVYDLPERTKRQIVSLLFNSNGHRNGRTAVYLGFNRDGSVIVEPKKPKQMQLSQKATAPKKRDTGF